MSKAGLECTLTRPFLYVNGAIFPARRIRTTARSVFVASNEIAMRRTPQVRIDTFDRQVATYSELSGLTVR
jgi:hypothetical protein